ncbi:ubiquitin carboxyl-terminal hydrolase 43 isoform X2 [Pelobates fuscus]|uniref:ubiquitin carboxyl-terminal hydrolase 43 isoform X2 n=1 Tax=Pelobates fuscus TaxID=191477 RepID=UPI002FE4EAB5
MDEPKAATKAAKEKSQGSRKLFRSRSLKSVGNFMQRILKTLNSLSHLGDRDQDVEDDDGGFKPKSRQRDGKGSAQEDFRLVQGGDSNNNLGKTQVPARCQDRLSWSSDEKVPGVQGLKNHGNTCFMNAVVQCLSNTDLLAEFLGMGQYRSEFDRIKMNGEVIREQAPEPSPTNRGEITETLASLVRGLWTLEYTPNLSVEFKNVVSKYGSQFRGNSQHDALEFLLWLLDKVNEDLNSSNGENSKTQAKPPPASEQRPTSPSHSLPAAGAQSFVEEHFQAQYRSSLTCPHCHKQSDTFDPFLCVSLPIPLRQTRALNVTLVFQTKQQRFLRIGLAVPLFGTVASLRKMVADEGKVPPNQVILVELFSSGFQRSFSDEEDLNTIAEGDPVYAFQAPVPLPKTGGNSRPSGYPQSLPSSPRYPDAGAQKLPEAGSVSSEFLAQNSKILILLCNTERASQQTDSFNRFGPPLLMKEERTMSWDQLQLGILGKIRYLMKNDAQTTNGSALFRIRVVGGPANSSYLSPKDARPLQHPAVDRALQMSGAGGPPHVKLAVEWDSKTKERLFGPIQEEVVQDAESVRSQQLDHQQQSCTLDECFQLYTKEEQLAPDDAWRCPHCKVLQQGTVKLSLWTLPDILIVHLKRFRQVGGRRNKLSTLVRFPLFGMDMTPHAVKRGQRQKSMLSPWASYQMENGQPGVFYDLYAVCNHHGSLQGGHYTAYCRNSLDARWYSYDDSNVEHVEDDDVCTRGAYLLFYQKRNTIPAWSACSSVRGSTSSSMSDHWALRLNGSKRESVVSRTATSCSPVPQTLDSPVDLNKETHSENDVGSESFVRGVKGRSASMKVSSATKLKLSISKAMPLRWSFGSKDKSKRGSGELIEYLESGRRPKYTNESIVPLMTNAESKARGTQPKSNPSKDPNANGTTPVSSTGSPSGTVTSSSKTDTLRGKPKEKVNLQEGTQTGRKEGFMQTNTRDAKSSGDNPSPAKQSGKKGDNNQRSLSKDRDNRRTSSSEAEGQQAAKFTKPRSSFGKESRKPCGPENAKISELPNGVSRTSLDNGVLGDRRTSGTMPRRHKEDLISDKSKAEIRRAQSSSNVQNKVEWTLKRSTSLHKNGSASTQLPVQGSTDKVLSGTLQRMRYQTSSLGRKKSVPESSF